MTPPIATARSASAMTSTSASSVRSTPSSVRTGSFAARAAHHDPVARQPFEIERVHRLADLEHHVVGDVDDVVDRADAGGLEALAQPVRRRRDRDLEDLRAVARAEVRRLDDDVEAESLIPDPVDPGSRIPDPDPGSRIADRGSRHAVQKLQRQPPDRRGFAREADVAQAIRSVRRDLEVDDRLAAVFHAGDLEAAQADLRATVSTSAGTGTSSRSQA